MLSATLIDPGCDEQLDNHGFFGDKGNPLCGQRDLKCGNACEQLRARRYAAAC